MIGMVLMIYERLIYGQVFALLVRNLWSTQDHLKDGIPGRRILFLFGWSLARRLHGIG